LGSAEGVFAVATRDEIVRETGSVGRREAG